MDISNFFQNFDLFSVCVANLAEFSLYARVAEKAHQRNKIERLCRYIARPDGSEKSPSINPIGKIPYDLKTPYHNATTQVIFEPVDFIARLAALAPKPRVNFRIPWCIRHQQ